MTTTANANDVPTVADSWARIDAWLAAHAPASLALLRPGATPAALAAAEAALGVALPADLAASLACHDGADQDRDVLPNLRLLSAEGVVHEWELRNEVMAELFEDEDEDEDEAGDEEPYWHRLWIPVAHFQGDLDAIDLRPGPWQGRMGWVPHGGGGSFGEKSPTLRSFLADVADLLVGGFGERHAKAWDQPFVSPDGELLWGWPPPVPGLRGGPADHGYVPAPAGLPAGPVSGDG